MMKCSILDDRILKLLAAAHVMYYKVFGFEHKAHESVTINPSYRVSFTNLGPMFKVVAKVKNYFLCCPFQ